MRRQSVAATRLWNVRACSCINGGFRAALFAGFLAILSPLRSSATTPDSPNALVPVKAVPFELTQVRLLDGPFKHAMDLDHAYLLKLEPDRLLAWFRKEAGLAMKAPPYGAWETQGVAGHSLGHYLSACSLMYASTGDPKLRDRVAYIVGDLAECQRANGNGYLAAIPNGKEVFAKVARGDISTKSFEVNGLWVPWYTLHKLLAGLRDSYHFCNNREALTIMCRLADWAIQTTENLNDEQWQRMLACEHGGMNEVLADLYGITRETKYLALSRKFHHRAILEPLAAGRDELNGKHANTQIPKLVGLARRFEVAGDRTDRAAAEFFWNRVVYHHSYVTGGHCKGEHFGPPDQLNDRLGPDTSESCNVYNMLKLTCHVFEWSAEARVGDFYERALYNHILSTQHPVDGRVIYNLSLAMGGAKEYQTQFDSFTCCVGTGMENHARYAEAIYFHDDEGLFLNLFVPCELDWKERGVRLRQETRFPDEKTTALTFVSAGRGEMLLRIRNPYWAAKATSVSINGQAVAADVSPASWVVLKRKWKKGDRVEITLPLSLRLECMPDNPNRVAIMYGPLVLAGELGDAGAVSAPSLATPGDFVPALITGQRAVSEWVIPVAGKPCTFNTKAVGRPRDVLLYPFFRLHDKRYTVYWDLFTESEWLARETERKAEQERERDLADRTLDLIAIGEMQSERDHNLQGENTGAGEALGRKWRHATDGGWFAFELKTAADAVNQLSVTYWGSDTGGMREFDILVDGTKVAAQKLENNRPNKFYDEIYLLPDDLTRGKTKVTVRFQAHPGKWAGGIFGARMLRRP
jgi:uncharacterized protein